MLRFLMGSAATAVLLLASAEVTFAQPPGRVGVPPRQYRSTTSPYLNLLDTRNSAAFNYYRRLRPEREFRRAEFETEDSIQAINRRLAAPAPTVPQERIRTIGPTGHPTSFRSLSSYFPVGRSGGNSFGRR